MTLLSKSFTLPTSILDDSPSKLFSELRRGVATVRRSEALPDQSQLLDIGFKRSADKVEVTLFFKTHD